MEDDGALPAAFLSGVEFAQMSDDALPGTGVGANAFDQREVDVLLAILGADVTPEKHSLPPGRQPAWQGRQ